MANAEIVTIIVGNDTLARAGLASLFAGGDGVTVSAQLSEDEATPDAMSAFAPQVILWDAGWGPLTPARLDAIRTLERPVLALVADSTQATEVRPAGVRGLLLRTARLSQLRAAVHALAEGIAVYDPSLTEGGMAIRAGPGIAEELTARELEVLRLLAEGLPNKIIAGKLGVTEHTVKFHVNAILGKLGAQSRTEAVTRATRMGLIIL